MTATILKFSRPAASTPWGACDEHIDVLVPSDIKDQVRRRASVTGKTISEYVRHMIMRDLIGEQEYVERMMDHMLGRVPRRNEHRKAG